MKAGSLRWGFLLVVLLLLTACAKTQVEVVAPPRPAYSVGSEEAGTAVWEAHPGQGRRPGRGEVYDMSQMTASHRTLPLGSRVGVESLLNRRIVEVRITGRDLSADGGILNLSPAAARALDALEPGVIPVRFRVVALPGSPPATGSRGFSIQVASFTSEYRATVLKDILDRAWAGAHVQRVEAADQSFYQVRVGTYSSRREARRLALRLAASGYPVVVMEE